MLTSRGTDGQHVTASELTALAVRVFPGCRWMVSLATLIGLAQVGVLVCIPILGGRIIDALALRRTDAFWTNLFYLGGFTLAQIVLTMAHQRLVIAIDENLAMQLRGMLWSIILKKPLEELENWWAGDILARVLNDCSALNGILTRILLRIVLDGITMVVVAWLLIQMDPMLGILTIAIVLGWVVVGRKTTVWIENAVRGVREAVANVTGFLQTWLLELSSIKIHRIEAEVCARFRPENELLMRAGVKAGVASMWVTVINSFIIGAPVLLIFGLGGSGVLEKRVSVGDLFAFISLVGYFNSPGQRLLDIWLVTIPSYKSIGERVREAMGGAFFEPVRAAQFGFKGVARAELADVEAVQLTYSPNGAALVSVPNFKASCGTITGLTGPNGSGKSTLLKILAGFRDPIGGTLTFHADGRRFTAAQERRILSALMPQGVAMFTGTLAENITLFDPDPDPARLRAVAAAANMNSWLDSLELGWSTPITPGKPLGLSGGEIRKIGLARVLYQNAPVLLLDEPTAGLDGQSVEWLADALSQTARDRVVIICSHSAAILQKCTRVYETIPTAGGWQCVARAATTTSAAGEGSVLGRQEAAPARACLPQGTGT